MRKLFFAVVAAASAAIASAYAQTYPSRPITMVVPYPAGGPTDTLARILAEHMRTSLGGSVI
jgi:tripartite-type tricarboxylate transporter receptor subunit TctC